MLLMSEFAPMIWGWFAAFLVAAALVWSQDWHGRFTMDLSTGVQRTHSKPTPRIGGIAVFSGVLVCFAMTRPGRQALLAPLILAGLPAFAFGVLEDLTKSVSVRTRLLATMACGILGWALTGLSITDVNIAPIDWLLGFTVVSVIFTAFAAAGLANAINIVDGFNGLAAGTSSIILISLGLIAGFAGDIDLMRTCLLVALPVLGFTFVNWPLGKIFLGDGGAYFVGFSIAWLCVLLLARHPEISAFSPLMVCAYPVTEVLYSMWRRKHRALSPGSPDRLHLHSLVRRRITPRLAPNASPLMRNSITGALMWIPAALPAVVGVLWPSHTPALALAFVVFLSLYVWVYRRISRFKLPRRGGKQQLRHRHT